MEHGTDPTSPALGLYAVAAFDVLGHSDLLKGATWPLSPGQDPADAMRSFVRACQNVEFVREAFAAMHGLYRAPIGQGPDLTESQRAQQTLFFSADVRFLSFSDTILAYVNLREDPTLVQGIYATLTTCASVFLALLAAEVPTRGAVDVGYAYRLSDLRRLWGHGGSDGATDYRSGPLESDGEICGPVIASVHHLESRIAKWPRVVIGDGLSRYLQALKEHTEGVQPEACSEKAVEILKGLAARDVDGWPVLDYLGEWQRGIVARHRSKHEFEHGERAAYSFVRLQAERYRRERNEKLALRYDRTFQYFRSRAHLWPGMVHEGSQQSART